ncbi:MAG: addiction module protein [Pyrinomonadaceae bacterium]|nr:addiction module protein [Pyrinomonadaceae bacterium]
MATQADKLVSEIRALPEEEKLRLLDVILTDLDKPDPELDHVWATEARKRWLAYKAGRLSTVSYEELMAKYNRQ